MIINNKNINIYGKSSNFLASLDESNKSYPFSL